ncbi:MAG: hypothetical protein EOO13_16010, partial [Chitinophagaceae bacterium]
MRYVKQLAMLAMGIALVNSSSAQLLKKLKEKAEKSLEGKSKSKSDNSSEDNNGSSASTASSTVSASSKSPAKEPATAPANGKVVFSLAADESVLYDETAIIASNTGVSYQFIIKNSRYEYFLISNGQRTGPFKNPPLKSANSSSENSSEENDVSMGDKKDPVAIQYAKTIGGKLYLVFNGKNYGPYDHVSKMLVSPDQKSFFASVTMGGQNDMMAKMGMGNTYIVSSSGIKQKAGAGNILPMKFYVSDNFTQAMIVVMDQASQKLFTATTSGKLVESSMSDLYSGGETKTMVSDKGDIITIPSQSPRQILVNGQEAASFKIPIENISRLTITPDISKSVYYNNGKLYKADGSEVPLTGILFPKVITAGNVTAVYYFKVFKNEN